MILSGMLKQVSLIYDTITSRTGQMYKAGNKM